MSTQHSKGPWSVDRNELFDIDVVRSYDGKYITLFAYRNLTHAEEQEQKANAARIVKCVNLLEGVENPAEYIQAARNAVTQGLKLREQNDRLLETLKTTLKALENMPPAAMDDEDIEAINDANEVLIELRLAEQEGGSHETA